MAKGLAQSGFAGRHIGIRADDLPPMLEAVGASSVETLIEEAIPNHIRMQRALEFGPALSEREALEKVRAIASKNRVLISMIGQGYYGTFLPPVIQRNVLENPAWYTAYTPYQSEISQGRLEALLTFQTMIADLAGLEIANASLLDEATAAAEAMAMSRRISRSKSPAFFVDRDCHPQTIALMHTRAAPLGWDVIVGDPMHDLDAAQVFGVLFQYPGSLGEIRDFRKIIAELHAAGAVSTMAADPLALTLLTPPGELGVEIAIGSTQRFGLPMGYGGPQAAFIASRAAHQRALPGRLVGLSVDARGRAAYRLALQTREQHIRREKATSNICTAQVLPAVIAAMYAVYHGADGLSDIARNVHRSCSILAAGLQRLGWRISNKFFFDTLTVEAGAQQAEILARAVRNGINLRRVDGKTRAIGISCDETTTPAAIEAVWDAFAPGDRAQAAQLSYASLAQAPADAIPAGLRRESKFLTHEVFNSHHSETDMLRYLRRLADRDLALDRSMIPLGSCTMKLNGTTEMMPLTWPELANVHPFAPADQAQGYAEIIDDLAGKLRAITGFDAISLQPNSGAQGEYAGLLVIRAWHRSRGESHRNICLIPSSAHGTNPASAHMAGMDVVVVSCDAAGNVDAADLRKKAETHAQKLAALMITYPSTHGVFEPGIRAICDVVHGFGGQVYLDGANLNAQVGLARPGDYGADVGHINLHKTFCIPHGGGGPGMGPIGVKAHLAPYLPGHPEWPSGAQQIGPVSAAPFGSASILTISWIYMLLMGGAGLRAASEAAILNANYLAARLAKHYPLLFKGRQGRVAHECILDLRGFKESAGISAEDIAKRLMDYGFHAPTMSFPVPGTLMIEPTESESRAELDRFCDAMLAVREEIRAIETGKAPRDDNVLKNAPHTVLDLADEKWTHPYSRAQACFPVPALRADKYWPPVNRVDNAYGDRHPICTCRTPAELQDAAA